MSNDKTWTLPPVDVYENADEYLVVADLAGVSADDLVVELERGELKVEGTRGERGFRRRFRVPDGIGGDTVRAELHEGVLSVHLPKPPEARPRRIAVNVG